MAEIKSSTKGWIVGIAIVALIAIGAYVFIKSTASADVIGIVQGSGYKFEVISKSPLNVTYSEVMKQYSINQSVPLESGFALRVRRTGTNQIVSKNIHWSISNNDGLFSLDKDDALVGIHPANAGQHMIVVGVGGQSLYLTFTSSMVAPPTVVPSVTRTVTCLDSTGGQIPCPPNYSPTPVRTVVGTPIVVSPTPVRTVNGTPVLASPTPIRTVTPLR